MGMRIERGPVESVGPGQPRAHGSGPGSGTTPLTVRAVSSSLGWAVSVLLGGPWRCPGRGGGGGPAVADRRLEPARVRRERLELIGSAPLVADLLSAALLAGVPWSTRSPSWRVRSEVPRARCLMAVHRRVELGEPVTRAWAGLAGAPGLGGVARRSPGRPYGRAVGRPARPVGRGPAYPGLRGRPGRGSATAVRSVLPLGCACCRRSPCSGSPHRGRLAPLPVIARWLSTDWAERGSRITDPATGLGQPPTEGGSGGPGDRGYCHDR